MPWSLLLLVSVLPTKKVYKQDLCKMDIVFRRLLRSIVGPPGDVDRGMNSFIIGTNE